MDMHGGISYFSYRRIGFTYDPVYEQYYMVACTFGSPGNLAIIGGQEITGSFYLATFDALTGDSLWWHEYIGQSTHWPRLRDIALDSEGYVYVTGAFSAIIEDGQIIGYPEFADVSFDSGLGEPFCMKLDKNGQAIWISHPVGAARAGEKIAVGKDGVFLGQGYASFGGGGHYWGDIYFDRSSGHGADPAVIHLDKDTGEAIEIYDIMGPGYGDDDEITAIAMDKLGNVVVGGYMTSPSLFEEHPVVPQMDKRSPNPSDFFIAKLGKNGVSCDDEWMSIKKTSIPEIKLWPNPTTGIMHISNSDLVTKIEVYDIKGRVQLSKVLREQQLDISTLSPGVYLLKIWVSGSIKTSKVIKK